MTRQPSLLDGGDDRVVDVDIAERMELSFLDYSMSVIVGRALPDVRDGLKPVQRRILHAMLEAGLRADRPHRKCASVIGDVMKKYHPHGDSAIYDALVRMAQDFSMRDPLVDGRGNFGSIDGDPPAAHRYTECRLSAIAMALLDGLDEDTVPFRPNYDGFETEPEVLPARLPNLLVNGATGIAVGMATQIPPHNLGEVIGATLHLLAHSNATVEDLMRFVPGPDFPTGARVLAGDGVRDTYLTGRGAITMEAIAATETRAGGLPRIVVTEIPYQVNKGLLLQRIFELHKERRLDAVRDLRDESSRDGMRIVVELKRGEDPSKVLAKLYALTDLRVNFNANMVALVGGEPKTIGLREALTAYVAHQREVLTRRTTHRRDKAAARLHVLDGLLTALDHLEAVIALIRAAPSADAARGQLMRRFSLTETQANAVLDMQLRRLAALERQKVVEEHAQLTALVAELEAILADPARLDAMLATELKAVRAAHATPRRTRLPGGGAGAGAEADDDGDVERPAPGRLGAGAVEDPVLGGQPVTVYVTRGGYLKAVPQRRVSAPHSHPGDALAAVLRAEATDTLLCVDGAGAGYRVAAADLPVTVMRQRGTQLALLVGAPPDAPLAGAVVLDRAPTVLTVSASGLVKRTAGEEYRGRTRSMVAAGVRDDDRIVAVMACGEDDEVMIAHAGGFVIRFRAADIRPMGRAASGVAGLTVPRGSEVVAAAVLPAGDEQAEVVTLAASGGARRTPAAEYPLQGRGGKGVQAGALALAWCAPGAALHVPAVDGVAVLRAETLPVGRRTSRMDPVIGPVTGPVVAEGSARG